MVNTTIDYNPKPMEINRAIITCKEAIKTLKKLKKKGNKLSGFYIRCANDRIDIDYYR